MYHHQHGSAAKTTMKTRLTGNYALQSLAIIMYTLFWETQSSLADEERVFNLQLYSFDNAIMTTKITHPREIFLPAH